MLPSKPCSTGQLQLCHDEGFIAHIVQCFLAKTSFLLSWAFSVSFVWVDASVLLLRQAILRDFACVYATGKRQSSKINVAVEEDTAGCNIKHTSQEVYPK